MAQNVDAVAGSGTQKGQIRYRHDSGSGFGPWTTLLSNTDTTQPCHAALSSNFAHGDAATQQLGSGTFRAGQMLETGGTTNTMTVTAGSDEFEVETCVIFDSDNTVAAANDDIFEFTILMDNDDTFYRHAKTITNIARITVGTSGTTFFETPSATAVGIVTFAAVPTFLKALAVVATGASAIVKKVTLGAKTVVATGAAAIVKKVQLVTKAVVAVGTPTESHANIFERIFAVVATGAPPLVVAALMSTSVNPISAVYRARG